MVENGSDTIEAAEVHTRLVDHVEVEVEVILGEARLSIADLMRLESGDTVPIDRKLSEAVALRVNGRVIAQGEIVSVDENFAVRVTEIGK